MIRRSNTFVRYGHIVLEKLGSDRSLIVLQVAFQLIINGIGIIVSGEKSFSSQVCPRLFFIRRFVDQNDDFSQKIE